MIPESYELFLATLFLNVIWNPLFFKYKLKWMAFFVIILMGVLAIYTYGKLQEKLDMADAENITAIKIIMGFFFIYPVWLFIASALTIASLFLNH